MKSKLLLATAIVVTSIANAQTTYKDVAPIFIAQCTSCHHAGGIQFPLTSYTDVVNNSTAISNDVQTGKMPPWPADATYKHYTHERVLTTTEVSTVVNWINAGLPAGDTTLAPPVPSYTGYQLNGTPDLIVKMPTYTSTASGNDIYVCFSIPTNLTQDRYLRAYELVPGNPSIVHHSVVNVDTTATIASDLSGTCYNQGGQFSIGDFAPGSAPVVFPGVAPVKFGIRIPAGSNLILQMHYPAGTAGQIDSTQIRMYFYPIGEPNIRPMYNATLLQNWNFFIPPYTVKTVSANKNVNTDYSLFSIFPHSHGRCKSILNYASNGTTTIPLCRINKWDFNWQGFYTFEKLLKIPSGYTLYGDHVFDNTANNPNNPNPGAFVTAGVNTSDEMVFDGFIFAAYQAGDDTVDIASILATDPLFTVTSIKQNTPIISAPLVNVKAYPNPFTDKVTLSYALTTAQYVTVSIYNTQGQEVTKLSSRIEASGNYTYDWNGKDALGNTVANDTYVYKIQAGKTVTSGKILFKAKN
jgi:FlgD Ig-like domain